MPFGYDFAEQLTLSMPRFEMRWKAPLKPLLTALGAPTLFSAGADLSGMADDPEGQGLDRAWGPSGGCDIPVVYDVSCVGR